LDSRPTAERMLAYARLNDPATHPTIALPEFHQPPYHQE